MSFASVYPHYVQKAENKGRTRQELDKVICWLTGYSSKALASVASKKRLSIRRGLARRVYRRAIRPPKME